MEAKAEGSHPSPPGLQNKFSAGLVNLESFCFYPIAPEERNCWKDGLDGTGANTRRLPGLQSELWEYCHQFQANLG